MRLFSKIVFICNCCFIISSILRIVEFYKIDGGNKNAVIPLPALEETIVILGFVVALIINTIFFVVVIYKKIIRKPINISPFIFWFNILLLPIQVFYQLIWKK